MMRQRQRKAVEDLYGSKFDAPKSQVTTANTIQKAGRHTERDGGYIISTNTPHNAATPANSSVASKHMAAGKETTRRKSARTSNKISYEKHYPKDTFGGMDDGGGESLPAAIHPTKREKVSHISAASTNIYENKNCSNYKRFPVDDDAPTPPHYQQHHHHHNHKQHHNHRHNANDDDEDKDDTDEFFELIRRTVEGAIGKTISDLLNRNFKELALKVERFSGDLKNTNAILSQMQNELNNTIGHYGEENSRHFRYLCMKSEYDKMFYQHQTLVATAKKSNVDVSAADAMKAEKRKSSQKLQGKKDDNTTNSSAAPCTCRSTKTKSPTDECKEKRKTSSPNVSPKSSEISMREVLQQIKKFCNQNQFNDTKWDPSKEMAATSQQRPIGLRHEDLAKINKEIFAEGDDVDEDDDDDDWEVSSDGMTPRNLIINDEHNYGGNTARGSMTHRGNNGAGDG